MSHQSRCHCGATQLTIKRAPVFLAECNCTFCSKHGARWAYFRMDEVALDQASTTVTYSSNSEDHQHHFCKKCYCLSYNHQFQSWNADGSRGEPKIAVNTRLLEEFDFEGIPVEQLDGLNQW